MFSLSVRSSSFSKKEYDLAIIGGGIAGLTAGIYAGRAGMNSVIVEKNMAGGQLINIPEVENWPGEKRIGGKELAKKLKDHAMEYSEIVEFTEVTEIKREEERFLIKTTSGEIYSKAIVIATGAKRRELGVPGEGELRGKGVSYCATCDGNFFIGKKVIVVGGGNTAFSEAIYLKDLGVDVTIVHRREQFRADKAVVEKAKKRGIRILTPYVVSEILGKERVEKVMLRNRNTGELMEMKVEGIFVAIGTVPNTALAKSLGVKLDKEGHILVDRNMRTNVPRVYAAGDVTGGVLQLVVAAAEGAISAISAKHDLEG